MAIYIGTSGNYNAGAIFQYHNGVWNRMSLFYDQMNVYQLCIHNGKLYALVTMEGTDGVVLEYNGTQDWTEIGRWPDTYGNLQIMYSEGGLLHVGGRFTYESFGIYRWNGATTWTTILDEAASGGYSYRCGLMAAYVDGSTVHLADCGYQAYGHFDEGVGYANDYPLIVEGEDCPRISYALAKFTGKIFSGAQGSLLVNVTDGSYSVIDGDYRSIYSLATDSNYLYIGQALGLFKAMDVGGNVTLIRDFSGTSINGIGIDSGVIYLGMGWNITFGGDIYTPPQVAQVWKRESGTWTKISIDGQFGSPMGVQCLIAGAEIAPPPSTITTLPATDLNWFKKSATLNGESAFMKQVYFEFDINEYMSIKSVIIPATASFSVYMHHVYQNRTYYFRAVGIDSGGNKYYGDILTFELTQEEAAPAYVTKLIIRGQPLVPLETMTLTAKDDASISKYGRRTYSLSTQYSLNQDDTQVILNTILAANKDPRINDLIVTFESLKPGAFKDSVIAADISTRITLINTLLGLDGDFFINNVKHTVTEAGLSYAVQWRLERVYETTPAP